MLSKSIAGVLAAILMRDAVPFFGLASACVASSSARWSYLQTPFRKEVTRLTSAETSGIWGPCDRQYAAGPSNYLQNQDVRIGALKTGAHSDRPYIRPSQKMQTGLVIS
jgi:hypothetical protein